MRRVVSAQLELQVDEPAVLAMIIGVADGGYQRTEQLTVTLDGEAVPAQELTAPHGTRLHRVLAGVGRLSVAYRAAVLGSDVAPVAEGVELLTYLRPSRYAESDRLAGLAAAEFGGLAGVDLLAAVGRWVGEHVFYVSGSSSPTDGACQTILTGQGVCRDFAHAVIALLRAMNVPARLAAVYAPGLSPMDFHAVAEAHVDGSWRVVDATHLAPRASMLRIATGRDAADTAFLSVHGGRAELLWQEVTATVDGDLPTEDWAAPISLC